MACGGAPGAANATAESSEPPDAPAGNPLLAEWNTPFGVPPFGRIEASQYLPAIRAGMDENRKEIDAIVNNRRAPDFANTIEALEWSGKTSPTGPAPGSIRATK